MEHHGIRYNVIQGIERGAWRWSVSIEGMLLGGQADTKPEAVAAAQRAIDKALAAAKKVRVVQPKKPSNETEGRSS